MIKRIGILFFGAICLLLSLSNMVFAQDNPSDTKGIYVGVLGGYVVPMDMGMTIKNASVSLKYDVALDNSILFGLKAGYLTPFTNKIIALELEYNHMQHDFGQSKTYVQEGVNFKLDGDIQIDALMFNILGRYPSGAFHPYAGLGVGFANAQIGDMSSTRASDGVKTSNYAGATVGVAAYQFLAGIDFDVTKNIIVGLSYKFFGTGTISYTSTDSIGHRTFNYDLEYKSHNFVLGVSYLF